MAVVVPIISEWNPKGVDRAMADIKKAEGKMGKMKAGLGKAFLPATAALGALGAAAYGAAKAGEELASSQAALNQVFNQMGNADAVERVGALADELERTLGVDEKLIMQVQTTLGTFKELGKTAGEVGGAFDRTTMAALDLAAAGFGTAESNAVQLGKALNDPIKGISALGEAGVTFTDQEKEKIKVLVESGKQLEAQNLVLEALENQVGGTAAATADSSAKMSLGFAELKENLGVALLPAFDAMNEKLVAFSAFASKNTKLILILGGVIGGLAAAIVAANIAMKAWAAAAIIVKAVTVAWTGAQWLLNAALVANPIGLIVVAIAAFIAIIVAAYLKVDWFRDLVDTAWAAIQVAIETVVTWLQEVAWPIIQTVFKAIATAVGVYLTVWKTIFETIWAVMKPVVAWMIETLSPIVSEVFESLATAVKTLGDIWSTVFDGIVKAVQNAWGMISPIIDKIRGAIDAIKGAWSSVSGWAGNLVGRGAAPQSVPNSRGRSSSTVNVNVQAGIGDPIKIAREIEAVFRARDRRLGST